MDELDDKLQGLAQGYHEPPTPPRELMWARIQAKRAPLGERAPDVLPFRPRPAPRVRRIAAWAAGIAAVLLIGFALGRRTSSTAAPGEVAMAPPPASIAHNANAALEVAALAHLRQAESYLTLFRASVRAGETDDLAVSTARELLASNRFLVNAPATDPQMRALLLDLELVLVGIAQLQATGRPEDIRLITDGLDEAGMLTRLRTASPRDSRSLPSGVL
jgi:hypothetical protein